MIIALLERPNVPAVHLDLPADLAAADAAIWAAEASLSERAMRAELNRQIETAGGLVAWCRKVGLSHSAVSLVKNGHRDVPEAVANACGFVSERTFRKIRGQ